MTAYTPPAPVQVLHIGVPGGGQVAQVGGLGGDLVGHIQGQLDAALVGDGGQVEHGVGGAAQGHVHRLGVVEGGGGHDVPGPDVLLHQFHDLHARVLGQPQPGGRTRRGWCRCPAGPCRWPRSGSSWSWRCTCRSRSRRWGRRCSHTPPRPPRPACRRSRRPQPRTCGSGRCGGRP